MIQGISRHGTDKQTYIPTTIHREADTYIGNENFKTLGTR